MKTAFNIFFMFFPLDFYLFVSTASEPAPILSSIVDGKGLISARATEVANQIDTYTVKAVALGMTGFICLCGAARSWGDVLLSGTHSGGCLALAATDANLNNPPSFYTGCMACLLRRYRHTHRDRSGPGTPVTFGPQFILVSHPYSRLETVGQCSHLLGGGLSFDLHINLAS